MNLITHHCQIFPDMKSNAHKRTPQIVCLLVTLSFILLLTALWKQSILLLHMNNIVVKN